MKLSPWIDSDLVYDTLVIATHARVIDIRASPYDATNYPTLLPPLSKAGQAEDAVEFHSTIRCALTAIPVESAAGRQQYFDEQGTLQARAGPVRRRLILAYRSFLEEYRAPSLAL
jgi:hypothetical protein